MVQERHSYKTRNFVLSLVLPRSLLRYVILAISLTQVDFTVFMASSVVK